MSNAVNREPNDRAESQQEVVSEFELRIFSPAAAGDRNPSGAVSAVTAGEKSAEPESVVDPVPLRYYTRPRMTLRLPVPGRLAAAPFLFGALLLGRPDGACAETSPARIAPSVTLRAGLSVSEHYGTEERGQEYEVHSRRRNSAVASLSLHLPVTERFGLQQEICYVRKGSRQDIGVKILEIPTTLDVTYDLDYIEIPALLRFEWRASRRPSLYSLSGGALSLVVHDRYRLRGEVSDGEQTVPIRADADMREVSGFDFNFVYGFGSEFVLSGLDLALEYRFAIGWNELRLPTYAYVPFGDEEILVENAPVPLRNQSHWLTVGYRF